MTFRPGSRSRPISIAVITTAAAILLFSQFMIVKVREESMTPTLADGQWILVLKGPGKVRAGDIAVFKSPFDSQLAVKRCVLAGPAVPVVDHGWLVTPWGRWFLTGPQWKGLEGMGDVPDGELYMVGDNQFSSMDSRSYGTIHRDSLVGRVLRPSRWRNHG